MPGLNYPLETFVESLSDKGISDLIKVGRLLVLLGEDSGGECGQGFRVAAGPEWEDACTGEASQPPRPL